MVVMGHRKPYKRVRPTKPTPSQALVEKDYTSSFRHTEVIGDLIEGLCRIRGENKSNLMASLIREEATRRGLI